MCVFALHDTHERGATERNKMVVAPPRALVWSSVRASNSSNSSRPQSLSERFIAFMFQPAVRTVTEGLQASGFETIQGSGLGELRESGYRRLIEGLGAGDVFVWIGTANMEPVNFRRVESMLRSLTIRNVLTVFYSTEAFQHHSCDRKRLVPVREIWEYTAVNVVCCPDDPSGIRVRYVPPGYSVRAAGRPLAASEVTSPAIRTLAFLGSVTRLYDMRTSCAKHIVRGLVDRLGTRASPSGSPPLPSRCIDSLCNPRWCGAAHASCPFRSIKSADSDETWSATMARHSTYLNLHKACGWAASVGHEHEPSDGPTAGCESFRLAELLASGANVFSEHCYPADEKEYEGLVQFLPIEAIAPAVFATWQQDPAAERARAIERRRLFAKRFAPAAIFERAGLATALASHRRLQLVWTLPGIHNLYVNRTERPRPAHERVPAFCCFNNSECRTKKEAAGRKVQVVLSQTIKGIGNKGELVSVAPAYAENVVVRGGLGVIASPEILADHERFKDTGSALRSAAARIVCANTKSADWCTERAGHCREESIAARCRATCNNCSFAAGTSRHYTAPRFPS